MLQAVSAPISVLLHFDHRKRLVLPKHLNWEGRDYPVVKIGLHHTYRRGRTLYHVFSVQTDNLFFRLLLDTDTLFWRVEQISDGEPD
jgi:hypothetical protein